MIETINISCRVVQDFTSREKLDNLVRYLREDIGRVRNTDYTLNCFKSLRQQILNDIYDNQDYTLEDLVVLSEIKYYIETMNATL